MGDLSEPLFEALLNTVSDWPLTEHYSAARAGTATGPSPGTSASPWPRLCTLSLKQVLRFVIGRENIRFYHLYSFATLSGNTCIDVKGKWKNCYAWGKKGYCSTSFMIPKMKKHCKKTCGYCGFEPVPYEPNKPSPYQPNEPIPYQHNKPRPY